MRKSTQYFSVVLVNFFYSVCIAQTLPEVSKPSLELQDNKLVIVYEIKNFNPEDKFKISIEVTDSDGNIITAQSFSGDIGDDVTGGNNKKITWDFKKDNFSTDTEIYVQVSAEIQAPPQIAIEETPPEESPPDS